MKTSFTLKIFLRNLINIIKKYIPKTKERKKDKILTATLGSIPFFGSLLSTFISVKSEEELLKKLECFSNKINHLEKIINLLSRKIASFDDLHQGNEKKIKNDFVNLECESTEKLNSSDVDNIEYFSKWVTPLHNLCINFQKILQKTPEGQFVQFKHDLVGTQSNPGKIIEEFGISYTKIKKELFCNDSDRFHLNINIIASLFIRSFFIYKPFYLDIPDNIETKITINTEHINVFFSFYYLLSLYNASNSENNKIIDIDSGVKNSFMQILHWYYNNIDCIDSLSFSYIINLIERQL